MNGERLYQLLLHAYPAGFREEYGAEMCAAYRALRSRAPDGSLWPRLLADIAINAPLRHLEALAQDLRYAVRQQRNAPAMTAIVVLTLGLGIGANTAIYSVVDALLFRQLPVRNPDEIAVIGRGSGQSEPASYPDYVDYRDRNNVFEGLAAFFPANLGVTHGDRQEQLMAELVTGNYFPVLGIAAAAGRLITPEEDTALGANPVVVIGHGLWKRRFNADHSVLGRMLRINGTPFTIMGVAEEGFLGSATPLTAELWVPVSMQQSVLPGLGNTRADRGPAWLCPIGRLKDGVTPAQAEAALNTIDARLQAEHPEIAPRTDAERRERQLTVGQPRGVSVPHLRRRFTAAAAFLLTVTGLVLVIACVNVANLLLARASARQREVAVRLALGASRRRLIRQLLTESLLLSLLGAAAGAALAWFAMTALGDLQTPFPGPWQYSAHARIDGRVLVFATALATATGILFGLFPAIQATHGNLVSAWKEGWAGTRSSRAGNRLRHGLVIGQVAVSMMLLVSSGLLVRSLRNLHGADPGFETGRQAVVNLDLFAVENSPSKIEQYHRELKTRMQALPGVVSAAWLGKVPVTFNMGPMNVRLPGASQPDRRVVSDRVDPDYFAALGIPILSGRGFLPGDETRRYQPIVVNQHLAAQFWPGREAIGERLRVPARSGMVDCEVIGIARDAKYFSLGEEQQAAVYLPYRWDAVRPKLLVRTAGPPATHLEALREVVRKVDPNIAIRDLSTFAEVVRVSAWPTRLAASLLGLFSLLGLVLTSAGLYGVTSYGVARRGHEIGIRMAVGASASNVVRMVLRQAAKLALAGAAVGALLAVGFARLLGVLLSGVSPSDPVTYAAVAFALVSVALLAAAAPARRATRVNPMVALRQE